MTRIDRSGNVPAGPLAVGLAALLCAALSGCHRRSAAPRPAKPAAPRAAAAAPAPGQHLVTDERYINVIRPMITRRGCDVGSCHGAFKGGGLYFISGNNGRLWEDYQSVVDYVDRKDPKSSLLLQKALGQVPHNGGKNMAEKECDTRRLLAWIGGQPDFPCPVEPSPQTPDRFAREVEPALSALGCTDRSCHGDAAGAAGKKMDLSSLAEARAGAPRPQVDRAFIAFMATRLNPTIPWVSPVIRAAWGDDDAHRGRKVDLLSCAYRRMHGYVAGSPESKCEIGRPVPGVPPFQDFEKIVMPGVGKRGCVDGSCHGSAAGGMSLVAVEADRHAALSDYLQLTARVEDPQRPDESTLLRTARNLEVHGGGKRLGGQGDCLDDLLTHWLRGQPVRACPPPKLPSFDRFVAEIQPTMDRMTCTQLACHGEDIPTFRVRPHPTTREGLLANYNFVVHEIDFNYMPLSAVQLRMREPCAYATVGAWITGEPRPACTVHDPDPRIFPKRDRKGNPIHPRVEPGPPPPAKT